MTTSLTGALPKRKLGKTDLEVSRIGLGTVKLGRNQGVKYPTGFTLPDDQQAQHLLAQAKDLGINLIDTAPAYGTSETRLGQLLRQQRHDWIICSKAGEEFIDGESRYDFSPEAIRASVTRSLERLRTDFIDIVLIHSDGNDLDIINQGALETLNDLKREGLIRATGMSTKTVAGGIAAAQQSDCVMVTYNLDAQEEKTVMDFCATETTGVLLKKVLASGHITAANNHADQLQKSMDFVFTHPGVTAAIVGTINPAHLTQNVAAVLNALSKQENDRA